MTRAYLGLGSNLGDRAANLWEAARHINGLAECRVGRWSPLYETEPVSPIAQPWYVNAALAVEVTRQPLALLRAIKQIERVMGREPGPRWAPRRIDIDILLYGDLSIETAVLTVPHRELWNRRFALAPLATIVEPGPLADRVASALAALPESPIVRLLRL